MVNYLKLKKFLEKYPKKDKHTHTIYGAQGSPGGAYTIPSDKTDELYNLLYKALFREQEKISIVEKVQPISRLVIDLDFKYKEELTERQYNMSVLEDIIKEIFKTIGDFYDVDEGQNVCWVMEKERQLPATTKQYKSKDGIHFLFPYIVAEKKTYRKLREVLINTDYKEIFRKHGFIPPSNSMGEIVDDNIYKGGNWFIYGSGKPGELRYGLTKIYKLSDNNLINIPTDMYLDNPLEIIKMNSVSQQEDINVTYGGTLLSMMSNGNLKKSLSSTSSSNDEEVNPEVINKVKKHDIEIAKELAQILSQERASNYSDWIEVGYCLHTISSDLLPAWIAFSKKWAMYNNSKECEEQWEWFNRNNNRQLTIKSLHYWAKTDNPDGWKGVLMSSLKGLVDKSIQGDKNTGPHADVANVIYHYFKDCFVCSNIKDNIWYYFNEKNGGKWEETDTGHMLRSKLSAEIVEVYMHYQQKYQKEANDYPDDIDGVKDVRRVILDVLVTNCAKVIIKLKDSGYKDKIMKECKEYFYDKEFNEKLNEQKHLLGFENGIFDLNKLIFREGLPNDYISLTTGIILPVSKNEFPIQLDDLLDKSCEIQDFYELNEALDDFLKKVFPIDSVREYTMRFLSSCLSGEIREEKFYFWTGSGGNGKSKLIELIDFSLGDYSRSMDVAFLTTKRGSSSSASPELESIKNARFVYMSEPEKTDLIYVGKLKQMTGGDKLTSRGLYKGTTQFKPQFKMALMCNDLPQLGGNDGGIWRRIEVVKYISKFTDNPKHVDHKRYQYLADNQLTAKLEKWNLLFILKLLKYYVSYDKEGTCPPEEVKKETKQYQTSNDLFANWFEENIEETDELTPLDELNEDWDNYCDEIGISSKQRLEKKDFKSELCKQQEKTEYGIVLGPNAKKPGVNGTNRKPLFNFKVIEVEDE